MKWINLDFYSGHSRFFVAWVLHWTLFYRLLHLKMESEEYKLSLLLGDFLLFFCPLLISSQPFTVPTPCYSTSFSSRTFFCLDEKTFLWCNCVCVRGCQIWAVLSSHSTLTSELLQFSRQGGYFRDTHIFSNAMHTCNLIELLNSCSVFLIKFLEHYLHCGPHNWFLFCIINGRFLSVYLCVRPEMPFFPLCCTIYLYMFLSKCWKLLSHI